MNASTCDECKWKDKEVLAKWVKATVGFLFVALVEFIIILFLLKS